MPRRRLEPFKSDGKTPRCQETVWTGFWSGQCQNRATTENGFCKTHDPDIVKKKRAARDAKFNAEWEKQTKQWAREEAMSQYRQACAAAVPGFIFALTEIANGHNDPRALARETLGTITLPPKPE